MPDPTSLLQPSSSTLGETWQPAKLELDEKRSTLLPGEYVYLLAHVPPGASIVKPFLSTDSGSITKLTSETQERSQAGLELNATTLSVNLNYYPTGTPLVVFFGNEIPLDINKLRSGIVIPDGDYDGSTICRFNVIYNVKFYVLRYKPNHPELIAQASGGVPFEEYRGSGSLSSWPFGIKVYWQ